MVFNMPTEARETHSNISPGHFHPRDISIHIGEHGALDTGQIVEIPARESIHLLFGRSGFLLQWEAAAHLTGEQISTILHYNLRSREWVWQSTRKVSPAGPKYREIIPVWISDTCEAIRLSTFST